MRRCVLLVLLALTLTGCSGLSNNSDYDSKDRTSDTDVASGNDVSLIEVNADSRDFSTLEISTCPVAVQVGDNSCGVQVTK